MAGLTDCDHKEYSNKGIQDVDNENDAVEEICTMLAQSSFKAALS